MSCSGRFARALGLFTALAVAASAPATASAYPSKGGAVASGKATIVFEPALRQALEARGIAISPLRPGRAKGAAIAMPVREGSLEPRFGSGYVFQRGGFRLRGPAGAVAVRNLVLNTNKKRLSGAVAGHQVTLAGVDDVRGGRTDFGIDVEAGTLRLTPKAAKLIGAALDARGLFRPRAPLGRELVSARLFTVPVTGGTIDFSLDEGFRQKLESLGVAVSPYEAATPLSAVPLAYSFPQVKGEIDRRLAHGRVFTSNDGLRLVQAGATPLPREVLWGGLAIGFENGYGGEGSDVVSAGAGAGGGPIGQIDFGSAPAYDPKAGTLTAAPTAATLSPYVVPFLNDTFAPGRAPFVAGEPLGTFAFSVRLR